MQNIFQNIQISNDNYFHVDMFIRDNMPKICVIHVIMRRERLKWLISVHILINHIIQQDFVKVVIWHNIIKRGKLNELLIFVIIFYISKDMVEFLNCFKD